ncbi:MAG: ATP-binding protein [Actinomycetes bacterium]
MRGYGLSTLLPPEPTSAGRARSFVTSALGSLGLEDLTDAAQLCTSELVTNALVHGRTDVGIAVRTTGHGVRVEVRDGCANGPLPKQYDGLAPTGRGLKLVADLACAVGVEYEDHSGKTIWFELDGGRRRRAGADAWGSTETTEEPEQEAVLLGLPVRLWTTAQQHHDEMLREMLLHRLEVDADVAFAPRSDLSAAEEAQTLLSTGFERARPEVGARPDDDQQLDLRVCLTPAQVPAFGVLRDVLDDAEHLAASGQLLALPAQPEVVALRDWCCAEVLGQAQGRPPTPWGNAAP